MTDTAQTAPTVDTSTDDVVAPNGLDAPTLAALRGLRRNWIALFVVGLVALTGGITMFARNWWREHEGRHIPGIVVSVRSNGSGSDTTADVRIRTIGLRPARTSLIHASSNHYVVGEHVSAIVDPFGGGHLTLPGSWTDDFSGPTQVFNDVFLFCIAPVALMLASAVRRRRQRVRSVVVNAPWFDYSSRTDETSSRGNVFVVGRPGQRPRSLRLTWTMSRSPRWNPVAGHSVVQIAGTETGERVVVRAAGGTRLTFGQLGVPGDTDIDTSIRGAGLAPRSLEPAGGVERSPVLVYRPCGPGCFRVFDTSGYLCGEVRPHGRRSTIVVANAQAPWCTFVRPTVLSARARYVEWDEHVAFLRRTGRRTYEVLLDDTSRVARIQIRARGCTLFSEPDSEPVAEVVCDASGECVVDLRRVAPGADATLRRVAAALPSFLRSVGELRTGGGG